MFVHTHTYIEIHTHTYIYTHTELDSDLGSIADRMEIRSAIQNGDVEKAMERVNDLNPELLETNPSLYFHLQQQRLIELIRQGKVCIVYTQPMCTCMFVCMYVCVCIYMCVCVYIYIYVYIYDLELLETNPSFVFSFAAAEID